VPRQPPGACGTRPRQFRTLVYRSHRKRSLHSRGRPLESGHECLAATGSHHPTGARIRVRRRYKTRFEHDLRRVTIFFISKSFTLTSRPIAPWPAAGRSSTNPRRTVLALRTPFDRLSDGSQVSPARLSRALANSTNPRSEASRSGWARFLGRPSHGDPVYGPLSGGPGEGCWSRRCRLGGSPGANSRFGNQDINGIVARQGGGQFELRLQFGREILQGMDRDIDFSAQ